MRELKLTEKKQFAQRHIAISNTVEAGSKARSDTKAWAKQELKPMQYFKLKIWSTLGCSGFNTTKCVQSKISIM